MRSTPLRLLSGGAEDPELFKCRSAGSLEDSFGICRTKRKIQIIPYGDIDDEIGSFERPWK